MVIKHKFIIMNDEIIGLDVLNKIQEIKQYINNIQAIDNDHLIAIGYRLGVLLSEIDDLENKMLFYFNQTNKNDNGQTEIDRS